jgi:hypothetical protein
MSQRISLARAFAISIGAHLAVAALVFGIIALVLAFAPKAHAQGGIAPNPDLLTACNQSAIYDASTNGSTRLVVGVATKQIYVCGFTLLASGTVNVDFVYGTGGACGTGTTKITPAFQFTAQTGLIDHLPVYQGLIPAPVSNDVCINTSAGVAVQAILYWAQW